MKHFRSRWERISPFFAVIFTFAVLIFVSLSPNTFSDAHADEKSYLQVKSSNFTVSSFSKPSTNLQINLNCDIDLPHTADDYLSYGLETDGQTFSLYNGKGETLTLVNISPGGTSKSLIITIKIKKGTSTLENAKNLDTIVILQGAKLSAPNPTVYAGIQFMDGLTLVKTNEAWSVQESQSKEENYEVELNATNAALSWNTNSTLLEATMEVPFTRSVDVSYASTLDVRLNNAVESVTAVQYAGESKIHLLFKNYVAPSENQIPCIRMQGGELTDSNSNTVITVSGDISFYEYVDRTWATEKYVQLKETVLGVTTERKLSAEDAYVFTLPQIETEKLYIGWEFQGELIKSGERVEIASYTKRTIETEAVLLDYASIKGASIRYDPTGDCSGMRFGAKLLMADFAAFGKYIQGIGMIVMPSDLLGSLGFTLENYAAAGQAKNYFMPSAEIASDEEYFTFYAVIAKILQNNYNRAFCARAYVLTEAGEYIWVSYVESRSVYQVATAIMDEYKEKANLETWQITVLETYLNGVVNLTYQNGTTKVISSALSPVITAAEVGESGNLVTITLRTQKTSFAAITYNGERIKNATQSYADGVLTITFDKQ